MRLIFMGTPEFAVPTLKALVEAGHEIVAVYSQPPRPANRGKKLTPSAVHQCAADLGLAVRTPLSLKGADEQAAFAALRADAAVVAAYGLILPQPILDAPVHGCLNIHGSLLPRWRGAAPVQRAILAGDAETGICIMQMEAGLDTGPVRATARTAIDGKTAGQLTVELADLGAKLMVDVLADIDAYPAVAQPGMGVTYAQKLDKSEARLNFGLSAEEVERQVRAFNPVPGAFFEFGGDRYRVLAAEIKHPLPIWGGVGGGVSSLGVTTPPHPNPVEPLEPVRGTGRSTPEGEGLESGLVLDDTLTIACNRGAIRPTIIQRAGKPAMPLAEFLRGNRIEPGTILQ